MDLPADNACIALPHRPMIEIDRTAGDAKLDKISWTGALQWLRQ
jgi:hypothetical protein